ncbi:MAG: hypothetical protein KGK03_01615 [Candidatus Omnitrophica bacterium]|nr:hypothetical protein [Candidatus Omnitrophota bacterium]MDE2221747.1 hypothetical protein [Candidatus Omnitrophota bacterium]
MRNSLIFFLACSLNFSFFIFPSLAQTPDGINSQDTERLLKAEEVILKKLKQQHVYHERLEHHHATQQMYQEALNLYRQQRMSQAQAALGKVEDAAPDYKSTVALQRIVDAKAAQELKNEMVRIRAVDNPKTAAVLENKARLLYIQADYLSKQKDTASVRGRLVQLKQDFRQLSEQVYIRRQLDKIAQQAEDFDQEIFKLTQAGEYPEAKKKFGEFQQIMIQELAGLKKNVQYKETYLNHLEY